MDEIVQNPSLAFNVIEDIDNNIFGSFSNDDNSDGVLDWIPSAYVTTEYNIDNSPPVKQLNILYPTCMSKSTKKAKQERKVCRNSGKGYVTPNGKIVQPRIMKEMGLCRMKCREKIDDSTRTKLFAEYWGLNSYNHRASYIGGLIEPVTKKSTKNKTCSPSKQRNRESVYKYILDVDSRKIEVCKKCFLIVFGETKGFVYNVAKKNPNPLI